jgi:hypothetical protein
VTVGKSLDQIAETNQGGQYRSTAQGQV